MEKTRVVKVGYTGKTEDGFVVDTTDAKIANENGIYAKNRQYRDEAVVIGAGMLLKGMDKALENMKNGDVKELTLQPKEAFGERNFRMIRLVPLSQFKKQGIKPVPGFVMDIGGMPARIQTVSGGRVRVDFNHPLAGKVLKYAIEIKDEASTEKQKVEFMLERFMLEKDVKVSVEKDKATIELGKTYKDNPAIKKIEEAVGKELKKHLKLKDLKFKENWTKAEKKK